MHESVHGPERPRQPPAFVSVVGGLAAARSMIGAAVRDPTDCCSTSVQRSTGIVRLNAAIKLRQHDQSIILETQLRLECWCAKRPGKRVWFVPFQLSARTDPEVTPCSGIQGEHQAWKYPGQDNRRCATVRDNYGDHSHGSARNSSSLLHLAIVRLTYFQTENGDWQNKLMMEPVSQITPVHEKTDADPE